MRLDLRHVSKYLASSGLEGVAIFFFFFFLQLVKGDLCHVPLPRHVIRGHILSGEGGDSLLFPGEKRTSTSKKAKKKSPRKERTKLIYILQS